MAYRVRSVYEIMELITLAKVKSRYGCKGAPHGLIYLPDGIPDDVRRPWESQKYSMPRADDETPETTGRTRGRRAAIVDSDSDEEAEHSVLRPRKVSPVELFSLLPESDLIYIKTRPT